MGSCSGARALRARQRSPEAKFCFVFEMLRSYMRHPDAARHGPAGGRRGRGRWQHAPARGPAATVPAARCSLNRVRTQTANSLLKLRMHKIFAERLRQGCPSAFHPQHFVQPKSGPCGVRAVHHSKRLDERSIAPPSQHAARPRYVLHQHAQTAYSKLPQDRLATACCVCAGRVRLARCT